MGQILSRRRQRAGTDVNAPTTTHTEVAAPARPPPEELNRLFDALLVRTAT